MTSPILHVPSTMDDSYTAYTPFGLSGDDLIYFYRVVDGTPIKDALKEAYEILDGVLYALDHTPIEAASPAMDHVFEAAKSILFFLDKPQKPSHIKSASLDIAIATDLLIEEHQPGIKNLLILLDMATALCDAVLSGIARRQS